MDFVGAADRVATDAGRSLFDLLRLKWNEVPSGLASRVETRNLLTLSDRELRDFWKGVQHESTSGPGYAVRGWYQELYRDVFRGHRVLEIGSGMGIDALHFIANGAEWHFSDIAASNLELLHRLAGAFGYRYDGLTYIEDLTSFDALPCDFDFIYCQGSLIHVPFDFARHESLRLLSHLNPGGRWIELCYPRERWVREGSPPFSDWGRQTDGEKTPWAEWYDLPRLRERLAPIPVRPLFSFNFHDDDFNWFDLRIDRAPDREQVRDFLVSNRPAERELALQLADLAAMNDCKIKLSGGHVQAVTGSDIWSYSVRRTISANDLRNPERGSYIPVIVVTLRVTDGNIGIGIVADDLRQYLVDERRLPARAEPYRVALPCAMDWLPFHLIFRNTQGGGRQSAFTILAVAVSYPSATQLAETGDDSIHDAPAIALTEIVRRHWTAIATESGEPVASPPTPEVPVFIGVVDIETLGDKLGYRENPQSGIVDRDKNYRDRKMETDDAPILAYLYHNHQPRRHLEFGTWEGFGARLCASHCDAEIWTLNLPEGEKTDDGRPVYVHPLATDDGRPTVVAPLIIGENTESVVQTDAGAFIGRLYREAGFADRVHQILVDSTRWDASDFADGFFDSILVDGGHHADVVTSDTNKAIRLLRPGGLMMWHDFCPADAPVTEFSACRGVLNAIHRNWREWSVEFCHLFWIRPSYLLIGVKR